MVRLLTLLFLISVVSYLDRINISVAGKGMIEEYGIDQVTMGVIFSSFVIGYALFQIPGGYLADLIGAKRTILIALTLWSLFTGVTGAAGDLALVLGLPIVPALVVVRFLVGAGEAAAFPSYNRMVASHIPKSKQGLAMGVSIGGIGVGAALTPPLVVLIMETLGWRWAFYISALIGIVLALVWWKGVKERGVPVERETTRFRDLVRNRSVWILTLSYSAFGYIVYVYYSWIFLYLTEVRGVDVRESALLSMLPFLALTLGSFVGGYVSDRVRMRWGVFVGRSLLITIFMVVAGLFIAIGGRSDTPGMAVFNLSLGSFFLFMSLGSYWALPIEISSPNAGKVSGIMNTGANLGGTVSPTLTPLIAKYFGWEMALNFSALVAFLGGILMLVCRVRGKD